MFQSKIIGKTTVAVRRLAAIVLVGGLCLIVTAVPVSAQTLDGGGWIRAEAYCYMATKTAEVSVVVQEPAAFASSGLYFYTEVWAKARYETKYNRIAGAYSPLIKTWSLWNRVPFLDSVSRTNTPATIFSTSFTGSVEAYYDIHVMWWSRLPSSSQWTGPFSFNLANDRDSLINTYSSDGFGYLNLPSGDCYL